MIRNDGEKMKDNKQVDEINNVTKKFNETAYDIGKLLISLSTGIVIISISLQKDILQEILVNKCFLISGWALEISSILLGTVFLFSMLRFYSIWENVRFYYKPAIIFGVMQYLTFILGLVSLTIFTAQNMK
jgi:hypothetical protein